MKLVVPIWPYDRWDSLESMCRSVRLADQLGLYGVFAGDHTVSPVGPDIPDIGAVWPDPIALASFWAAQTQQIQLVFHILVLPTRHPITLAKQLATVDVLSQGRIIVGIGSGWLEEEFRILGVPFDERGPITDEYLRAIKELWQSETPTFSGKYVAFSNLRFEPRPFQKPHPRLMIGGQSRATIRRIVEHDAGWDPLIGSLQEFRGAVAQVKEEMTRHGRDPESLDVLVGLQVGEGDDFVRGAQDHVGGGGAAGIGAAGDLVSTTVAEIKEWEDAGATHVLTWFKWGTPEDHASQLQWLAQEILPRL